MTWLDELKSLFVGVELPELSEEIEIARHPEVYEIYSLTEVDINRIKYTFVQFAAILINHEEYRINSIRNAEIAQITNALKHLDNFSMDEESVDKFASMLHDAGLRATHPTTEEQS